MTVDKALLGRGEVVSIGGPDPMSEIELVADEAMAGVFEEEIPEVGHFDNLAEHIDEADLAYLGLELNNLFEADKRSRRDWERSYEEGLKLLGLKIEKRSEPWEGACGVFHPLLTESVVRFQSHAIMETFPAAGPVKTKVVGDSSPEIDKQAMRVQDDMNYLITEEVVDYRSEHERMLFNLPLSGSAFKKCWFDPVRQTPISMFVPADDLVVAYGASSLSTCPRFTHMIRLHENELLSLQKHGFYCDCELGDPRPEWSTADDAEDKESGVTSVVETDDRHLLLEVHVDWDLEDTDFADPDGIPRPYIITVARDGQVLSIRRNWDEGDPTYKKRQWFSHYCYLPGLGFYGIGLIHLIGGITTSATSTLRQLVDAGTLANLPGGFKSNQFKAKDHDRPIEPGEFRDVDVPGDRVRDAIMPLPYKEPSVVLFQLLEKMAEEGRRLGSIAEMDIGSAGKEMPVGTTLALIERSLKVMSAVQARLHAALKVEFKILARIIKENMPPEYPFMVKGGFTRDKDYDGRVDVIPVSDPNATTQAQKVIQYQAAVQTAQMAPELYNRPKLHRGMLDALQIKDADEIVPLQEDMKPRDPVAENMMILKGEPVRGFLHQDHEAHIAVHLAMSKDPKILGIVGQSPMANAIQKAMAAHITEHVAFQYRVELEQKLGAPLPGSEEELPPEVERQLAPLIADAAGKLLQKNVQEAQAKKIAEQQKDPILQMQMEELEIKKRKQAADEEIEREKLKIERERIDSSERQTGARVGLEAAKTKMAATQAETAATDKAVSDATQAAIRMAEVMDNMDDKKERREMEKEASRAEAQPEPREGE